MKPAMGKYSCRKSRKSASIQQGSTPYIDIDKYDNSNPPERVDKSIATYLKEAFAAIIGDDDSSNSNIPRTLAGLKSYLEQLTSNQVLAAGINLSDYEDIPKIITLTDAVNAESEIRKKKISELHYEILNNIDFINAGGYEDWMKEEST